jgi:hypothetical protein
MPRLRIDTPLPWERQPEESPQAWEGFIEYRDMLQLEHDGRILGRRSQREVGRRLGKSSQLIDRWAKRHQWRDRVAAYDSDLDRDRRAALRSEAILAVREHAQIAAKMVMAIAMPLEALFKPQRLLGPSGHQLVNEDGEPLYRDRAEDIEGATTPELLMLLKQLASILPIVTALRAEALGNPNEPLPELPEWGIDDSAEDHATHVPADRMLELLRAADEAGLLDSETLLQLGAPQTPPEALVVEA